MVLEDPSGVVHTNLANIIELIKKNRFNQCLQISKNMLDLSSELKMKDKNIMCKIIFDGLSTIDDIKRRHEIPDALKKNLNVDLITNLEAVYNAHNGKDESVAYSSLKDLHDIFIRIKQDSMMFPPTNYSRFIPSGRFIGPNDGDDDEEDK